MIHDLYLRAHTIAEAKKDKKRKDKGRRSQPVLWPDYALVFDTETELNLTQKLNFGVWQFCKLQNGIYVPIEEGIFYRDGLDSQHIQLLRQYVYKHMAYNETESDADIVLLSRTDFVEKRLWESVRAGALIVGFNLPFDIARISLEWKQARNGGFSFILSHLNKKNVENLNRPRIRITSLNGVAQRIELAAVKRKGEQRGWSRGRILDLHALAFALTNESYSLASACRAFGCQNEKMDYQPTGQISEPEIHYARQDVCATLDLLNALKHEYERHPIELLPDRAYSPASIGKAYLRAMGVAQPMQQFSDIPPEIHGKAMAAYFGGRAECRIRRWPVPVVPVDITSEYPSVDALLGVWDLLTAERITIEDATEDVRRLLAELTLDDLFKPETWKRLNFFAQIRPDGDILPVRSVYDDKSGTCNIGLNEFHWKQPIWIAGPDLAASKILSGKTPDICRAFRIVPHGKQNSLKPIKLRGAIPIDPASEDFFTRSIEYRKQSKADDRLQYFLKILANSTSYGTYLELNPEKINPQHPLKVKVYSGELEFMQLAPETVERPGVYYFPPSGALITAGGRLLLAMIEQCVRDAGGTYLCCDTDALIIVANQDGGMVQMPDGAPPIKALSWAEVEQITRRFDSLCPYDRQLVPHLLRHTDENDDEAGNQRQLFGYAVAAKRYVLYTTRCGQPYCGHRNCIKIIDPKAHGLIFMAPADERENGLPKWWWELWKYLLALEFRQIMNPDINILTIGGRAVNVHTGSACEGQPPWIDLPAMMKMRISTPHYLGQMKDKASPFGFVLHPRTRGRRKLTLLTPFSKDRKSWPQAECVNTHDGQVYRLDQLPKSEVIKLGDVLTDYIRHPELKSLGPDGKSCKPETRGLLRRMNIKGGLQRCIGKEVSRFEQGQNDFIENIDDACIHYDGGRVTASENLRQEIARMGLRKVAKETGLDRKTIRAIMKGKRVKMGTLARTLKGMET